MLAIVLFLRGISKQLTVEGGVLKGLPEPTDATSSQHRMNPSGPAWLYQGIRHGNLSRCTRRYKDSMTEPLKRRSPVLVSALWVRRMRSSTASIGEMCL